jgi:hypothetical protein
VHGLQPVANIRQRAADDYRHRVVEIRTPHLVFDVYMIAFRTCFHLTAFPVQSATQSGPDEEILSLSLALFQGKEKRAKHHYQSARILAFFSLFGNH